MLNPMSLAGEGIVAIWNGIRPEGRAEFFEWHSREHMPERVGIPGFLRGRRYIALQAHPEFFTLYETQTTAVLTGADYFTRLNSPTPWTRRATAAFTDTSRSLCRVALSLGPGEGGLMMTFRFEDEKAGLQTTLSKLEEKPGICGVHYCIADREGSDIQTEEKKGRPTVGVPAFVVMVEGGGDRAQLETACADIRFDQPVERGLYQLQYAVRP